MERPTETSRSRYLEKVKELELGRPGMQTRVGGSSGSRANVT